MTTQWNDTTQCNDTLRPDAMIPYVMISCSPYSSTRSVRLVNTASGRNPIAFDDNFLRKRNFHLKKEVSFTAFSRKVVVRKRRNVENNAGVLDFERLPLRNRKKGENVNVRTNVRKITMNQ